MRIGRLLILICLVLLVAVAAGFVIDLRPARPPAPARLIDNFRDASELRVGAARVGLKLPENGPVAGYPPPRPTARSSAYPLQVRAVVLESGASTLALASAELLEIPPGLAEDVRRDAREMGLNDVVLTATHTHTGLGGYDPNLVAQVAATGRYDPELRRQLTEALVSAIREARNDREPVHARAGRASIENATANRAWRGGAVDPELRAVEFVSGEGHAVARILVFGAHPTLVSRQGDQIDGDYPGRVMRALEAEGSVVLFMQGAFGDVRSRPPEGEGAPAERMAAIVTAAARQALASAKDLAPGAAYAAAQVTLPPVEAEGVLPRLLRRAGANLLTPMMPDSGYVEALEIGGERLLFAPAEPTVAAAAAMRQGIGEWAKDAIVVGLANGYLGYLETPERFQQVVGESKRALYGPELLERIEGGLRACVAALSSP